MYDFLGALILLASFVASNSFYMLAMKANTEKEEQFYLTVGTLIFSTAFILYMFLWYGL